MRFSDALDRKMEDIQRPPNLPIGHYVWTVSKLPDMDEFEGRSGDTFERLTFQLTCVSAHDDVDPDELAEYGNPAGAVQRKSFLFTNNPEEKANFERSMFNLKRFLHDHLGLDSGLSLEEALANSVGQQCLGELKHRPDPNDPEIVYSEVGNTAAI